MYSFTWATLTIIMGRNELVHWAASADQSFHSMMWVPLLNEMAQIIKRQLMTVNQPDVIIRDYPTLHEVNKQSMHQ